jgi:excinuclease ABC subunit C
MDTAPLRIECYDVSQIQGTDVVASMVVFEDGLPRKSEYRRFVVRGATDDLSAISEVLRRRFARYLDVRAETGELGDEMTLDPDRPGIDPTTGRPRKFAYPPQLVVVDGGEPQVRAAAAVLHDLGIDDVALCGLAKRLEEVWVPGDRFPLVMSRTSEGLYLLQRVRDEAHRFAIAFHRQRRSKRMTVSALDDIPGLGEIRRKALMRRFGSVKRLGAASIEEISEVPGVGRRTAEAIRSALSGEPPSTANGSGAPAATTADATPDGERGGDNVRTGDADAAAAGDPAGTDLAATDPAATDRAGTHLAATDPAPGDLAAGRAGAPPAGDRPAET